MLDRQEDISDRADEARRTLAEPAAVKGSGEGVPLGVGLVCLVWDRVSSLAGGIGVAGAWR